MSKSNKAALYGAMKGAGVKFPKHYREYTEAELQAAYDKLQESQSMAAAIVKTVVENQNPIPEHHRPEVQGVAAAPGTDPAAAAFFGIQVEEPTEPEPEYTPPVRAADPREMAGARLNAKSADEPLRIDPETRREWYQEEVRKPAIPTPRGRRVLEYKDPGAVMKTVKDGEYTETFEIAGDPRNARSMQVKITLPSYQVGIYKDPRFPFKVVCYNGNEGFERDDVNAFYGGAELVPPAVLRKYVENVLCYDIRSVVTAINQEHRDLALAGRLPR